MCIRDRDLAARTGARKEQLRPDALALCYPVITAGEYTNEPTITAVDAKGPGRDYWSVERHVTSGMPPVFLWHTMDDELVPAENSLIMAWALHRAGVSCECHLYETGPHGLSVCTEEVGSPAPDVKNWVTPVSYTHLDVYKRQCADFAQSGRSGNALYQRQTLGYTRPRGSGLAIFVKGARLGDKGRGRESVYRKV